ncbi:2,3-dihydro-2,3-dihydroxybenzoate dehydrogenase [Ascidiaceihabitans donghaensis]|uniref:Probable oxidoreductase n=1 Tax=Ascidiaceihabitans donghaensis TaxID=1510460 RepID=A0A2R8BHP2_9RHOB|nr:oxidoreductase [Ascidiaceihabitans donghaensis]SPH22601.1 2,3-dihydro-2,3-dihydroxybenzoate dehydrogenase [Ascidiaceihabitans donghaensis]
MAASDQQPTNAGFPAKTSALDVLDGIDLSGKTAVVTGGYSGIGLETVKALAAKGAKVIVPVRSPQKAQDALAQVNGDVTSAAMDLADITSVRRFAADVLTQTDTLDLLINNAGIMACPETRVGPGWEAQFGVCHMGHFALTQDLMPALQKASGARVVALSSTGHKLSDIRWDDVHYTDEPYDKWQAYGQAKTANALFANALARRLKDSGGHAFSVHPGGIFTPLQRHLPKEEMIALGWLGADGEPSELAKQGFKTPEQGASTTVWAATAAVLDGKAGVYCEDCDVAAVTDPDSPTARFSGVNAHACDDDSAERLWALSQDLLAHTH